MKTDSRVLFQDTKLISPTRPKVNSKGVAFHPPKLNKNSNLFL